MWCASSYARKGMPPSLPRRSAAARRDRSTARRRRGSRIGATVATGSPRTPASSPARSSPECRRSREHAPRPHRPCSGERRCGCPGSTCRSPRARTNGSCTRPRTIRRRRARHCPTTRPRRSSPSWSNHTRSSARPSRGSARLLRPNLPVRSAHATSPAVLRLGDARRLVGGRTPAVRGHDDVLVVLGSSDTLLTKRYSA